ncbi:MAG: sodium ion-translocating decarboxylase subunit beta [Ruthenibacterium sp.]
MQGFLEAVSGIASESGFVGLVQNPGYLIMIAVACGLLYLAIVKQFEPLLLLPIAFGMLLANLPFGGIIHMEYFLTETGHPDFMQILNNGGLADMLYLGVKLGIYPPLIFLGIGTMTDFGPLISNPKSLLLGAAAQLGIFVTYFGAKMLGPIIQSMGVADAIGFSEFTGKQAGSIAIIGGADGPTAIYVTTKLAPELLGAIAVAAYSYMALVPIIQPPIMRLLTTKKERSIVMTQLRTVSKTEKIIFPIMCTIIISLILPSAVPLIGMLMLGNLMKESGVVERINKTAGNELMNIITIFLGISVGCTTSADTFLNAQTLFIVVLGLIAFCFGTAGGVLLGKVMCFVTHGKVNPLIGSAGVSAVPMAARVSQKVGQKENPQNFLLMHAMGPNVAGVIGSAVAAGVLINMLG